MKFTYIAKNPEGETYTKTVEAPNRFDVYGIVRKEGGVIISISEEKAGIGSLSMPQVNEFLSRVSSTDKILLTRNLSVMLSAGLPLSRALDVLARQSRKPKLQSVLASVKESIAKGGDFHSALEKHPKVFSRLVVSMVRAGEESGKLAQSLMSISQQLESTYELQRKIRGAMIYPSIIVVTLIIIGTLMLMYIVPTLTETFESLDVDLPATTKVVIGLSNFLVNNTVLFFVMLIGGLAVFLWGLRTPQGRSLVHTAVLYIPMIKTVVKEIHAARTARTLSSLLSAGVAVVSAFEITEDVIQNHHFRAVITEAKEKVQQGAEISSVFLRHEHLYPPLVGELLAVGEETGKLPDMMNEVARYYEGEVDQKTKNMSTFVEPFLMLIVGGAVGFFAVSMISPIYSITSAF